MSSIFHWRARRCIATAAVEETDRWSHLYECAELRRTSARKTSSMVKSSEQDSGEIYKALDDYVIGQTRAKRNLSLDVLILRRCCRRL